MYIFIHWQYANEYSEYFEQINMNTLMNSINNQK